MKKIVLITLLVILGCGVATFAGMYFSYNNKEIALRAKAEAQVGKIEGVIEHADQIPGEEYRANTTIKAYVIELKDKRSRKGNRQSNFPGYGSSCT